MAPLFIIGALICSAPVKAEKSVGVPAGGTGTGIPGKAEMSGGVDVVLLLDCSGKMKQIDPHDYRKPAAKLFISLLGVEDSVSIIGFGDTAREIAPLTRNTPENRKKLFNGIDNITAKEFNTNLTQAVEKGFENLKASQRKNRVIILLSDGMLDLGSAAQNDASYQQLKQLLSEIHGAGIAIHTISFSEFAERELLSEIALTTNGTHTIAKSDVNLHVIFASVFEKIKSPESIPLQGDGFLIDPSVQEVILLITKKAGTSTSLIDPLQQSHALHKRAKNIAWHESAAFAMITISKPEPGTWKVQLSSTEGNRIFVVTDLKLKSGFSKDSGVVGDKLHIDGWLEKSGVPLKDSAFLRQVAMRAEIVTPEQKSVVYDMEQKKQDAGSEEGTGIYGTAMGLGIPGEYRITIRAEGRTFQREKTHQFKVFASAPERPVQASAATSAKQSGIDWKKVFITFGVVNAALGAVLGLLFVVCKTCRKRMLKLLGKEAQTQKPPVAREKNK